MPVTTTTVKGQVVIPAVLRKKLNIHKGTKFSVEEQGGRIILDPLPEDCITAGRGLLKTNGDILKMMLKERQDEVKR